MPSSKKPPAERLADRLEELVASGVLGREIEAVEIIQDAAKTIRCLYVRDRFFSRHILFAHMEFFAGKIDELRKTLNAARYKAPK